MRVCIVSQYFQPDPGAASTQTRNHALGLVRRGNEVVVITAVPHYPMGNIPRRYIGRLIVRERIEGIEVVRVAVPPLPTSGVLNRLIILLCFSVTHFIAFFLIKRPDILFGAGGLAPSPFNLPTIIYGKLKKVPIVLPENDSLPETHQSFPIFRHKLVRDLFASFGHAVEALSDSVVTYTGGIRKIILSHGVSPERVYIVPLPVDTELFRPHNTLEVFKTKRKLLGKRFVVMYSGALASGYDFDTLFACAKMLHGRQDIVFVIRGEGELRDQIKKNAQNMYNVVVFGPTKLGNVSFWLSLSDVLVAPMEDLAGWVENVVPTKVFEYMACGRAVICCCRGETEAIIKKWKVGLAVPPRMPNDLHEAILYLKDHPEERTAMGQNARKLAVDLCSLDRIAEKLEMVFSETIARRLKV